MTKLSNAWLRLATSSLFFVGNAAFAAGMPTEVDLAAIESAKGSAAQSGAAASGQFGSKAAFTTNISIPTTSPTLMKTIDGSAKFEAQLSFPASNRFLEILVQPSVTGDLSTVIAGEDLDMDGNIDYSYQVPFPVSGICANGVIGCTAGSWLNCNYYEWSATTEGRVSLLNSTALKLGGCYCINTFCGSNLVWSNLSVVLKDLGGGAVGAIQKTNPSFAISDVSIDGTKISYSGQDLSRPPGTSGAPSLNLPMPPPQTAYYSSPMSITGETQTSVTGQSGDSESLFSLVTNLGPQQQTCVERRIVSLKAGECIVQENTQDDCSSLSGRSDCRLKEELIDGVTTVRNSISTGLSVLPSSRILTGDFCPDVLVTRSWWEKKKVFVCDTEGYDFTDVKKRFGMVTGSLSTTGTAIDYQDTTPSPNGVWSESFGAITPMATDPVSECEMACQTRKPKIDSQTTLLGPSSKAQIDTRTFDYFYRVCATGGVCPAAPGEEILKECQCLNEFNEAASIMQMLRLGNQDAVCSDGVPAPIKGP